MMHIEGYSSWKVLKETKMELEMKYKNSIHATYSKKKEKKKPGTGIKNFILGSSNHT